MDRASQIERISRPFSPSWIDRLDNWAGRLPGPIWSTYLGIGVTLFIFQLVILWVEGAFQSGYTPLMQGYLSGAIAFFLFLCHHLDQMVSKSLENLRPALKAEEDEYHDLHYQISTLPATTTLVASLLALTFVLLSEYFSEPFQIEALDPFPASALAFRSVYLATWWVFGAFIFHTIRQLKLVHEIYSKFTRVNLFQMKPLYAFSNHSALTALSLAAIPYGWVAISLYDWTTDPTTIFVMLGITLLAILAFLWPQWGIHRLQVAEKDRLVDEANRRLEASIFELHRLVDEGEVEKIGNLSAVMAGLQTELSLLEKTPTWPWRPETVRWLASALLLPLGLWLMQLLLQRILS